MARTINPQTAYKVVAHTTHGHIYASVQRTILDKDGKNIRRHWHIGVMKDNLFTPQAAFLALSGDERDKFIFPKEWDLSLLDRLSNRRGQGRPELEGDAQNRLYGDIWLLEQIAEHTGVRSDLEKTFNGNKEIVKAILTLAVFPYLTKFNFNRVERWQRIAKTPCDFPLTAKNIAVLTQSITEKHRLDFLSCRALRLQKGKLCAVDSTSRSAYGESLTDIHWGKNKELLPLEQILSVVVYTLSSHMPVYYRTFPGNMPDSRSLDVIMKDLEDAGFPDVTLVTDRGYDSLRNVEKYIQKGQAMLMAVKIAQKFIIDRIRDFGNYDFCPDAMTIDRETELAWYQCDMDYEVNAGNGRTRKAEKLKLNIYLDVKKRTAILLKLRIELENQKEELEEMLRNKIQPADIESPKEEDDGMEQGGEDVKKKNPGKENYGYYKINYDKDTGLMQSYELNQTKIARKRLLAGYFASISHRLDFSAMEAFHHYKLRDEQEKYFEQMKDQMEADRQRCWSEEGWSGRQLILFVGLILASYARHIWKEKLRDKFSTSLELFDEMRSIRCIEHPGHARKITPFVGAQLEICKAFGIEPPKGCSREYVSIRKQEKKRGRPPKKITVVDSD